MVLKKFNMIQGVFSITRKGSVAFSSAFSLVEMLMALLVASLLLAALAPVMTRKITGDNINISGTGGGGKAPAMFKCWDYDDPELQLASDGSGYKVLPNDFQIDDAWVINFILASGGGGGAGATNSNIISDSYTEPNEGKNGIKIEQNMDDFEIEMMTGGGGGAGGGAAVHSSATCTGSASVDKCECMGQKYDSVNKVCVSNNLGSKNLANAKTACNNLTPSSKWQLPTMTQLGNWKNQYSNYGIKNGNTVWSKDTSACSKVTQVSAVCCKVTKPSGWYRVETSPDWNTCNSFCYPKSNEENTYSGCYSCTQDTTTSCGTNYHYYTLSGTSWNAVTNITTNTNSRSTYCMYTDTGNVTGEKFYSLSGGGGSASPSIVDNNFDSTAKNKLREKIKANIGGYIVLDTGKGGEGGSGAASKGAKAYNGANGSDSCIIVQNSSRQPQFKLCVKGGNGGYGADANKTNASSDGYGRAGSTVSKDNGCYTYDYTLSSNQKVEFACTNNGKPAGNGGAGTSNPTTGGKGGASILNSNQVTNSGKDGVTPNSTTNPGAGGGGGTTTKTGFGSSASFAFGKGGDGAKGYIKLKYKHYYEAAGGGGGGGGYVAHIKNINIGKSGTCSIKVGYGGAGGAAGVKGTDGGDSSVVCSNSPNVTYRIFGGKGGNTGTSASSTTGSVSSGGTGGEAGTYDNEGNIFTRLFTQNNFIGSKGLDGKQGGSGDKANYKEGIRSAGGRGGTSGTGEKGKCGGIYNESGICSNINADENNDIAEPSQEALNGQGFSGGDISIPTKDGIVEASPKYGKAGAGGGGGAWYMGKEPGKGGGGQGGYVCIYWDKLE